MACVGLSVASAVPFAGWGAAAAKLTKAGGDIAQSTSGGIYRGARPGEAPSFAPRPNDYKVDPKSGVVKDSHGVSVFDNPASVSKNGFTPHRVDESTIPSELRVIQRGSDPSHFEIVPRPGANLTPAQFAACLSRIECR